MNISRLPIPLRSLLVQQIASLQSCRRLATLQAQSLANDSQTVPLPQLNAKDKSPKLSLDSLGLSTSPTTEQLKTAHQFWTAHPPNLLFSQANFRLLPASHHPEVAFLGRSNVGKSSLLNALFNKKEIAHTSRKPGKTRLLNGFGVSPFPLSAAPATGTKGEKMNESWRRMRKGLIIVDMPGYGAGSRADWGKEITKFLEKRTQLRKAFLLVDVEHGLKSTDMQLLQHFFHSGVQHTIVFSKADKLLYPRAQPLGGSAMLKARLKLQTQIDELRSKLQTEIWRGREVPTEILYASGERSLGDGFPAATKIGINELRWAVMAACGITSVG